jgi:hypothetical protein
MSKTAIIIAILFPSAFTAMPVLAPLTQPPPPEQSQIENVIGAHRARVPDRVSMGPDPGGKSGDTVTPTTTSTTPPSTDGTSGSNQSGASSGKEPGGTTSTRPAPSSTSGQPRTDH